MRTLTHILIVALSTASPALFAQFTMGGLGTSMGMMGDSKAWAPKHTAPVWAP